MNKRDLMTYEEAVAAGYVPAPASQAAQAAQEAPAQTTAPAAKPTHGYYAQMQNALQSYLDRPKFQFDLNGNALYQQYKDQYAHLGQQAMQDTMGKAAGLTGGYGSSYGQAVGQQAYNEYLTKLNEIVPSLHAQERQAYNDEGTNLYNQYQLLQGQYSNAYNHALTMLQMGIMPSDEVLANAGISKTEAQAIGKKYGYTGGSSGSGSSSGGYSASIGGRPNYGNYDGYDIYGRPITEPTQSTSAVIGWTPSPTPPPETNGYDALANQMSHMTASNRDTMLQNLIDAHNAGTITDEEYAKLKDKIGFSNGKWLWD